MTGFVKSLISSKGFGFISANKKEYFFHRDDYQGDWNDLIIDFDNGKEPIQVEFEEVKSSKGPRAAQVRSA